MGWLSELFRILPSLQVTIHRKTTVQISKVNVGELEVCKPKMITRERPFWRSDKVDIYHALPDGSVRHTPGD